MITLQDGRVIEAKRIKWSLWLSGSHNTTLDRSAGRVFLNSIDDVESWMSSPRPVNFAQYRVS